MKRRLSKIIIIVWTALSFLIDLHAALTSSVSGWLIFALIVIEVSTCWVAYEMFIGKRWALIALMIYYGIRIVNVYTEYFSFYTKSGLNVEISLGDAIGINVFTLIFFILLVREFNKQEDAVPSEK